MWRAYFDTETGALVSVGSPPFVDPTPTGLSFNEYADPMINLDLYMWDATVRGFVLRPAAVRVDRLQDLITNSLFADFQTVWNATGAGNRTRLTNALAVWLGDARFRDENESVIIQE